MGSDLPARSGGVPGFLLWALGDAGTAPLQRLQVVKGWVDSEGETFESVYDVACSGGATVDPDTHRCPDNGARVDLSDCTISGDGAAQLRTLWRDPEFEYAAQTLTAYRSTLGATPPVPPMISATCVP